MDFTEAEFNLCVKTLRRMEVGSVTRKTVTRRRRQLPRGLRPGSVKSLEERHGRVFLVPGKVGGRVSEVGS